MIQLAGLMLQGMGVSLQLFSLTLLFSMPLALLVTFGRMSHNVVISSLVKFYILIMRGTPLILQLIFIYFAPKYLYMLLNNSLSGYITSPGFWDAVRTILSYKRFPAAIIAFTLNYAAYFAEIYRGGIESISRGQYEAAKVLGFTGSQTFGRIVLPQVIKRILPASGNEVITLVKDTALARVIGVMELFHTAQGAADREFSVMPI
jgi:polar amino acid transport system permease protein